MEYKSDDINQVFKLRKNGRSWAAAARLSLLFHELVQEKIGYSADAAPVELLDDQFYQSLQNACIDDASILSALGLNTPAILIKSYQHGLPRAYRHFPRLYMDRSENPGDPDYYLFVTRNYDGSLFHPADATVHTGKANKVNAHSDEDVDTARSKVVPILNIQPSGCALPADFSPVKHFFIPSDSFATRNKICFVPAGQSLHELNKLTEAFNHWRQTTKVVVDEIIQIVEDQMMEFDAANPHLSFEFDINTSCDVDPSDDDKPIYYLTVSDFTGRKIPFSADRFFDLKRGTAADMVLPSIYPDGEKLRRLMAAVPAAPDIQKTPLSFQIGTVNLDSAGIYHAPQLCTPEIMFLGDDHRVLVYTKNNDGKFKLKPKDAIPFSTALYIWIAEDNEDIKNDISPPPMPARLKESLAASPLRPAMTFEIEPPKPQN